VQTVAETLRDALKDRPKRQFAPPSLEIVR
jgi:hypothetical protein